MTRDVLGVSPLSLALGHDLYGDRRRPSCWQVASCKLQVARVQRLLVKAAQSPLFSRSAALPLLPIYSLFDSSTSNSPRIHENAPGYIIK